MTTVPFDPESSHFNERMALGHWMRLGHELRGYYTVDDRGIHHLVRTCCEEGT